MKVSVVQAVLALLLVGSCSADSLAARSFDVTRHFNLSANSTCGGDPPTLFEDQSAPGVLLNCTSGEYEARLALDGYSNTRWQSATGHTPVTLTFSLQQVRAYQEGGGADCGWCSVVGKHRESPVEICLCAHGNREIKCCKNTFGCPRLQYSLASLTQPTTAQTDDTEAIRAVVCLACETRLE